MAHPTPTLTITMPTPTDPADYPLIRELLQHYPTSSRTSASSSDTHPSNWLSDPSVVRVVNTNMPVGYSDPVLVSSTGHLLMYGCVKASWRHCLLVEGLPWGTLKADLGALFEGHDNIEPPLVLGNESEFMALVYMGGGKACEEAIADLDGAVIEGGAPLRVRYVGRGDLGRALRVQGSGGGAVGFLS